MREHGIYSVQNLLITFMKGISKGMREELSTEFEKFANKFGQAHEIENIEFSPEARAKGVDSLVIKGEMMSILDDIKSKLEKSENCQAGDIKVIERVIDKLETSMEETQAYCGGFQTYWRDLLEQARNENALKPNKER